MQDITSPGLIVFKGLLFTCAGVLASAGIIAGALACGGDGLQGWRAALLHVVAVWCFCRAYYFAFYVIGKYVDPSFRFSGLCSAAAWLLTRGRGRR